MKRQVITKGGIILLVLLFSIISVVDTANAAAGCTIAKPTTNTANSGFMVLNFTNDDLNLGSKNNITQFNLTYTGLDSNVNDIKFIGGVIRLDGATQEGATNASGNATIDTTDFAESTFSFTVNAYNDTNSSLATCAISNIRIDNSNIGAPTINAISPADNAMLEAADSPYKFNVTSGTANEQIRSATLFLGSNQFALTAEDTNQTTYSVSLTDFQVQSQSFQWYIRVTDSDGTTTADSSTRTVTFEFEEGGPTTEGIPPEDKPSKGFVLLLIGIIIVIVIAAAKKNR